MATYRVLHLYPSVLTEEQFRTFGLPFTEKVIKDTKEFPEFVSLVDDYPCEVFIKNMETDEIYRLEEFFQNKDIKYFEIFS